MARSQLGMMSKSREAPLSKGISRTSRRADHKASSSSSSQGYLDDDDKIQADPLAEPCDEPERDLQREGEITFEADGPRLFAVAHVKVGDKWLVVKQRIPLLDNLPKAQQEYYTILAAKLLRKRVDKAKKAYR